MKKLTVWALLAMLVVAGSAFAAPGKIAANATFSTGGPATTNNDDSCDIGVTPAATLLLPYFEVDLDNAAGETTLFTITNTSNLDAIAHVTLWTDYSFPVIDFNIYLTGYDVQAINLYDIIKRGVIAPDLGTGTAVTTSKRQKYSDVNPNLTLTACDRLPGALDPAYVTRMQSAFTLGVVPDLGVLAGCNNVGNTHDNAVGYATIDVADACTTSLPTDAGYFSQEIRFDNVLIGDYQQVNSTNNFAQGNPMVHIRAIPEGGEPGVPAIVNFDRTFYSRFQAGAVTDRRQPLPSVFAARWIQGGASGFNTYYKIWREGDTTNGNRTCATWDDNVTTVKEIVRFDEAENGIGDVPVSRVSPPITTEFTLPETSLTSVADSTIYPQLTNGAVGGWMYLNLDNSSTDSPLASQNWVVVSMRAEGRYSVDFDAAWLANGCTQEVATSEVTTGTLVIGPGVAPTAANQLPNFNPNLP